MTPSPQDAATQLEIPDSPEPSKVKIVISGMSGLYPDSHSVKELSEILYNKVNPISAKGLRYKYNHPEVVQFGGKVPELNCFDAQFFKVHFRLSLSMDPMARKILENAYQAIYDAGVNPEHLSGKKIGVYIGTCFSETEKTSFYEQASRSGIGIAGCSKTMFANRVSYWLNAKGPSMSIDEACCSSTAALEQAYLALSRGECEAAIVGGGYLCLHPQSAVHYGRLMKFCDDGKTKSFDENADGCAKSEAINVLFLQKADDALRVYAQLIHAKSEFTSLLDGETGPKFGFERDINKAVTFIKNFYDEAKISPQAIEYVEAVGCAVPEADKMELQSIEQVYCGQRDTPLLVGSVLSNIGYNEAASGISAITKVLLGYHTGQLAANLHCSNPRKDVVALKDGRMRIITEHESFGRTYAAVNGMSVTGLNSHVLLHGQYRPKDPNRYKSSIPYLVTVSGRHEEAVNYVLDNLKSEPIDPEQLRLLNNIHQSSIAGHLGRGFTILKTDEQQKTVSLCEKSEYFDDAVKPLWFVYSGMGSQWAGMGKQLMRFPIFAAAIEKCRRVLEPKGLDLVHIITTDDATIFDNILHSFVGIAAIQIGLTDILYAIGLNPDGIIGHSVGELGCAYGDGCLTAEEMILSAYSRGLVSRETPFIHGCMAAVGLGYEQIAPICPPEIDVACHNGPESSTISGPADITREFVAELTAKGIFAKDVACSNIAYHSRYIAEAGPQLLKYLSEVIKSPKPRSKRWISSSVPQDKWDTPAAQLCSAEYHTNNQLNPVLFEESSKLIPKNAVLVEIAPHGLLQAILKRSLASSCINIALTRRKHPDNAYMLLESIGKLFMEGYNTKLHVLYPEVELPVSTGTPFLSHLVKWAHGEKWPLALYRSALRITAATCDHIINRYDAESSYLQGHSIRGRKLYPFAATLVVVWDTLAMVLGVPKKQLSVNFTDLRLYAQPIMHDLRQLKINVTICRGTGNFEVLCENTKVVTGYINVMEKARVFKVTDETIDDVVSFDLTAEDIYKTLRDRDYSYNGEFRSIERANESFSEALLAWNNNWVTLIDGLLQLTTLRESHTAVSVPTKIRVLDIDVKRHKEIISNSNEIDGKVLLKAEVVKELNATRCGGIFLSNVIYENLPPVSEQKMSLKALKFVPNTQSVKDISSSLEVFFQIVRENVNKDSINAVGIVDQPSRNSIFNKMNSVVRDVYGVKVKYEQINQETALKNKQNNLLAGADVVLVQNLSVDDDLCQLLHRALRNNQFVISEDQSSAEPSRPSSLYRVFSAHTLINDDNSKLSQLQLARWGAAPAPVPTTTVTVRTESDLSLLKSARTYMTSGHRLLVIAPYPSISGLKEVIQTWRAETIRNKIDLIMVHKNSNEYLSVNELPKSDLAVCVLNNETWGGEYYVPVSDGATVSKNVTLQSGKIGDLDSLTWVEASETDEAGIDVMVHYAGLNKTDVKKADGSICDDAKNSYGMDFSGVTKGGQRVMGLIPTGAASSVVRAQPELLWPVPAHWSLEDAATVPLAYAHAFYCLAMKAYIRPGYNILVHGGSGALGQAVISIALGYGCQVLTTVSDARKKRFLLKLFPELKADHIGYSRDATFRDMVKSITRGQGCDIVIHSTGENLKNSSVDCVAQNGCCVDVSQLVEQDDFEYGLYNLTRERNYVTTDFFTLFDVKNIQDRKAVYRMIVNGITSGLVRPLSRLSYAPQDVSRAFRLMAGSRHRGKVLLNMNDRMVQVQPRITCNSDRSHLILCKDETYGLQFADRLVERGAKNICIHFKGQSMSYLQLKIRSWQKSGVKVLVFSDDLNGVMDITALVNSAARLGPLEGVYVTVGDEQPDSYEGLVTSLDLVTRKLCSDIKYFAVLNVGSNNVGKNTCLKRAQNKLPATLLSLPQLSDEAGFYRSAMDATERALRNGEAVQRASLLSLRQSSLLQKIAAIAKITIPEITDNGATLEDLGLKSENISRVECLLRVEYNVSVEVEQIPSLTVETIIQLDKTLTRTEFDAIEGLSNLYTYVDVDELLATTEIVFLPTLTNSASMRDDEFDVNQTFLCIVPGIEGHNHKFHVLCERLKLTALVLQPGLDRPHETVRETAERYAEALLKKTGLKKTFYLLGYESGVSVALEVASILEDHGLTGVIYCIGYSPDGFTRVLEKQLSKYETKEQLQDAVARHMFTLMANGDATGLDNALQGANTWSQKVDACVRTLLGRVPHSAQYARMLIETALVRIEKARDYVSTPRALRSQLVQLLPVVGGEEAQGFSLQQHSQQPVIVHELQVPLAQATNDLRCSSIINNFLSNTILEDFQAKNTCDTYLNDANSFVQMDVSA